MDDDRERETIIVAFHEACPCPTPDDVARWTARFPRCADDLRFHADASIAEARRLSDGSEPSAELLDRTRARAMQILAEARGRTPIRSSASLDVLAERAGIDLPALARALSIGRAPLVDLFQGRIAAPVPKALVAALAAALRASTDAVASAIENARPRMGRAKASSPPGTGRRSFEDAIRDDLGMTPEQKASWLARIAEWNMDPWIRIRSRAREAHRRAFALCGDRAAPAIVAAALRERDLEVVPFAPGTRFSPGVLGVYERVGRLVSVDATLPPSPRERVLAHQIGHHDLHHDSV